MRVGDIYGMLVDVVSRRQVQSMDDNCGEWVESMGVVYCACFLGKVEIIQVPTSR